MKVHVSILFTVLLTPTGEKFMDFLYEIKYVNEVNISKQYAR